MDLGLKDNVALVSASSRGLGKAAAQALAMEGARVVICSRTDQIEQTAAEISAQTKAQVLAVKADITKQEDIDALVATTINRFGKIDILVTNAGGPPPGNFLNLKPSDWEFGCNLTLMSMVRLCYAVIPFMISQKSGSIVAIQSYTVKQPMNNLILSNSIRMAVIGLIKSLANELGPKGIRVNSINPAWTQTERVTSLLQDRAKRNESSIEEEISGITKEIPLGRIGTPEEFGRTVAWLASPAASFINGHALMFDGGAVQSPL